MNTHNKALVSFLDSLSAYEDEKGDGHVAGNIAGLVLHMIYSEKPHEFSDREIELFAERVSGYYHGEE